MSQLLEVDQLHVSFKTYGGEVQAVRGVSFTLNEGETLAIVGESGCGKSVTAQTIMGLVSEPSGRVKAGHVWFKGKDLTTMSEKEMRKIRGAEIAMIFQDPMTSLNPTITVGNQITEGIMKHQKIKSKQAQELAIELLQLVGIANPKERLKQYPHQFSGGMRQRIMIAIALACNPAILIADEPTTALDVTIQAQIIELFKEIQLKTGIAIVMITHDLGVVAKIADRVHVMYAGKVMEAGTVKDIFYHPQHPYTKGLLGSVPKLNEDRKKPLQPIPGTPPDLFAPPPGCPFAPRCEYALEVCTAYEPTITYLHEEHHVACWLQDDRAQHLVFPTNKAHTAL